MYQVGFNSHICKELIVECRWHVLDRMTLCDKSDSNESGRSQSVTLNIIVSLKFFLLCSLRVLQTCDVRIPVLSLQHNFSHCLTGSPNKNYDQCKQSSLWVLQKYAYILPQTCRQHSSHHNFLSTLSHSLGRTLDYRQKSERCRCVCVQYNEHVQSTVKILYSCNWYSADTVKQVCVYECVCVCCDMP